MKIKRFTIQGHDGYEMAAELDLPEDGYPKYFCLYVPCFTCTKNLRAIKYISKMLNKKGISLFRFDFPGLGESEGDFSQSNFSTNLLQFPSNSGVFFSTKLSDLIGSLLATLSFLDTAFVFSFLLFVKDG